jgi:hypothetical protein
MYSRNIIRIGGLVVKLALPGKVTRRAYKVFGSDLEFNNPHLKRFYNAI